MATEAQCKKALDLYEQQLSTRKNVVGLGIVPVEEHQAGRRDLAVAVYVKKKLPRDHLSAKDVVPETLELRGRNSVVRVPTRVIEQGEVELETLG